MWVVLEQISGQKNKKICVYQSKKIFIPLNNEISLPQNFMDPKIKMGVGLTCIRLNHYIYGSGSDLCQIQPRHSLSLVVAFLLIPLFALYLCNLIHFIEYKWKSWECALFHLPFLSPSLFLPSPFKFSVISVVVLH